MSCQIQSNFFRDAVSQDRTCKGNCVLLTTLVIGILALAIGVLALYASFHKLPLNFFNCLGQQSLGFKIGFLLAGLSLTVASAVLFLKTSHQEGEKIKKCRELADASMAHKLKKHEPTNRNELEKRAIQLLERYEEQHPQKAAEIKELNMRDSLLTCLAGEYSLHEAYFQLNEQQIISGFKILLEIKPNIVNCGDDYGQTPLHVLINQISNDRTAAGQTNSEKLKAIEISLIKLLLEGGADLESFNGKWMTPYDLASRGQLPEKEMLVPLSLKLISKGNLPEIDEWLKNTLC